MRPPAPPRHRVRALRPRGRRVPAAFARSSAALPPLVTSRARCSPGPRREGCCRGGAERRQKDSVRRSLSICVAAAAALRSASASASCLVSSSGIASLRSRRMATRSRSAATSTSRDPRASPPAPSSSSSSSSTSSEPGSCSRRKGRPCVACRPPRRRRPPSPRLSLGGLGPLRRWWPRRSGSSPSPPPCISAYIASSSSSFPSSPPPAFPPYQSSSSSNSPTMSSSVGVTRVFQARARFLDAEPGSLDRVGADARGGFEPRPARDAKRRDGAAGDARDERHDVVGAPVGFGVVRDGETVT